MMDDDGTLAQLSMKGSPRLACHPIAARTDTMKSKAGAASRAAKKRGCPRVSKIETRIPGGGCARATADLWDACPTRLPLQISC